MELATTSVTGNESYFDKIFKINITFEDVNRKKLRQKNYGGNITLVGIIPISVYTNFNENLEVYNKRKSSERSKNYDGKMETAIFLKLLINPLDVDRLTLNQLQNLYCDLIKEKLNSPDFKIPKNFGYAEFKLDMLEIVCAFREIKLS